MAMIAKASKEYGWAIDIGEVCRIWKGGCIIRSTLLRQFEKAFKNNPELANLLMDESMIKIFARKHKIWRKVVANGVLAGIPCPL